MVFLITIVSAGLLIYVIHIVQKRNFPSDKNELIHKHNILVSKGDLKAALHLCYSYIRTIEDNKTDEFMHAYFLISQDLYRLGSVSDAIYFSYIASCFSLNHNSNRLSDEPDTLENEIKNTLTEMKTHLSEAEHLNVLKKVKTFEEKREIIYPSV
jgi:uncharacterized protein with PhoU and TrkA domain